MDDTLWVRKNKTVTSNSQTFQFYLPGGNDEVIYEVLVVGKTSTCLRVKKLVVVDSTFATPQTLSTLICDTLQKSSGSDIDITFVGNTLNGLKTLDVTITNASGGSLTVQIARICLI